MPPESLLSARTRARICTNSGAPATRRARLRAWLLVLAIPDRLPGWRRRPEGRTASPVWEGPEEALRRSLWEGSLEEATSELRPERAGREEGCL